ncbi:hypothetical protein TA3x_004791 [Tundrisphaera sp. TA3]|uniref:hypothetical protein n=1 Tax=Tundrisphaera sp. TA3 TaxID=3435775 RepID=UPI003EB7E0C8
MIGLMVVIESTIARHELWLPEQTMSWAWKIGRESARADAPGAEILCFGDSLVKHGVLPRVLEAELGRRAYNLALPGAQPPATYFQLRKALEAGAKPDAVIVDFNPATLTASVQRRLEFWPELLEGRDLIDLGWESGDGPFIASTVSAWVWPSIRHRRGIREAAHALITGMDPGQASILEAYVRNGRINRGAIVSTPAPMAPADEPARGKAGSTQWRPHPTNVPYVGRFLDLAAAHRLRVYWVIPPFSPSWQARNEWTGLDARYTRFVDAMVKAHPGLDLVVVDGRSSGYARDAFSDTTHLNARGASAFSRALAAILRATPPGRDPQLRRIPLPAYGDRPGEDELFEDFERSRSAVARRPGDARIR